jgi:poly(A) polymerase
MNIPIENKIILDIAEIANKFSYESYLVGGYVRDLFLKKDCTDIDILVVGNGIDLVKKIGKEFGINDIIVYERFGTAMIHYKGYKIEFVGARKESYNMNSRKPAVSPGTLNDDLARRDFTINALTISLNKNNLGDLIDIFNGMNDLEKGIIRTPLEPEKTFSDDPLRMIRAIRFSSTLGFKIDEITFEGIKNSAERIKIISQERITDEVIKILSSKKPSTGFKLLHESNLLPIILPEVSELNISNVVNIEDEGKEYYHKNVFYHSLQVLDNVSLVSENLWLRVAALLHDIGKPKTRYFEKGIGWSFHGHDEIGSRMIGNIFKNFKFPLDKIEYVKKLVKLHLRPIALIDDGVTDSAVRRLLFEADTDVDDLMILCKADITSKNMEKVEQFKKNYEYVEKKMKEVEEKDRIRNFQPAIKGDEIMTLFNFQPGPVVGILKNALVDAILDGVIQNKREEALLFLNNFYNENKESIYKKASQRFKN